jgi:hypothetical protein
VGERWSLTFLIGEYTELVKLFLENSDIFYIDSTQITQKFHEKQ